MVVACARKYPIRAAAAAAASWRSLMIRPEPWQSAVRLMSQAGPGPGFGFLNFEYAMLVRAPQLHVQRLAALAVPDHHGPSLGAGFPSVPPVHQYDQGREQVMAFFGEQVLMAFTLAGFAIRLAVQHAVLDERGESLTEQGPRTADVGEELLEAARAVNASRSTSSVHFSPTTSRVRLIEQSRTRISSKLAGPASSRSTELLVMRLW